MFWIYFICDVFKPKSLAERYCTVQNIFDKYDRFLIVFLVFFPTVFFENILDFLFFFKVIFIRTPKGMYLKMGEKIVKIKLSASMMANFKSTAAMGAEANGPAEVVTIGSSSDSEGPVEHFEARDQPVDRFQTMHQPVDHFEAMDQEGVSPPQSNEPIFSSSPIHAIHEEDF